MSELEMEEGCPGGAVREDDGKVMSRDQGRQKRKTRGAHPISTPAHAYVPPPINPTTIPRRSSAHHPQMAVPSPPSYPPFLNRRPNIHHSARSADPSRPLLPPSASLSHPPTHTATTPRPPIPPSLISVPPLPFHRGPGARGERLMERSAQYASGASSAEPHQRSAHHFPRCARSTTPTLCSGSH